ncbi:Disrupted in schizophrenia 1 protein [Galemys pyrenaicus]|uniref:Disrupted in schizophrenia 1 protein n=1 Tax=Galemys pyrenaicus TaxID=202257 RepID=A0A8J6ATL9_GALPY|nr:Disrupted in schizophrenia 1 protein [Galemys pyrenaicus]
MSFKNGESDLGEKAEHTVLDQSGASVGQQESIGNQACTPPSASFRRRRLARRPGYMRSTAGPQIGFLSPAVGTPFWAQGGVCSEESESTATRCGLDSGSQWQGPAVGSPVPKGTTASILTSSGHLRLALSPVKGAKGLFGIQLRATTKLPSRFTRSCGPGDIGSQGELQSMDSAEPPDLSWDAAFSEGTRDTWTKDCLASEEVSSNSCSLRSGLKATSAPEGCQDAFTSSFSFIQLSLGAAGERGEAEGCLPSREAEAPHQSLEEMEAKAANLERPHEDSRPLSLSCSLKTTQGPGHCVQAAGGSPSLSSEKLVLLATHTASSCSLDPSWLQGNILGAVHPSDLLLRKCVLAVPRSFKGKCTHSGKCLFFSASKFHDLESLVLSCVTVDDGVEKMKSKLCLDSEGIGDPLLEGDGKNHKRKQMRHG